MRAFFNFWILLTLALFYVGPIPWENRDNLLIGGFVLICLLFFNLGIALAPRQAFANTNLPDLRLSERAQYAVIVAYIILSALYIQQLTGLLIFNPSDYSFDFGDVYDNFQESVQDVEQTAVTYVFTLLKMMLFPIVVYIFCDNFGKNYLKIILIAFPLVASSLMRGTDKEMFDIAIIVFVILYYKGMINRTTLMFVALVPAILLLFVARRVDRFGGNLPICLPDRITCFDFQSTLASVSPSLEILYVFLTSYISQGYVALGLALDMDAGWGFGLGHLPPLQSIACSVGNIGCDPENYQEGLRMAGWNPEAQWTSVYPILANDFTFIGVPLYFAFVGVMFALAETQWKKARSNFALCMLLIVVQFVIFSSANMQIAISVDWVMATLVYLYLPGLLLFRLRSPHAA